MTWVKVDDKAPRHKKQLKAGAEACWLWVCGLAYAKEQPEHDGRIPSEAVAILYPMKNPAALAAKLVQVGLWEQVEDGYQIHDWDFWNGTHEEVAERKQKARERAAASYDRKRQSASQTRPPSAPILRRRESAEQEQSAPNLRDVCGDSSGSSPSPSPIPSPDPNQQPPDPELSLGNPEYPEQIPADWEPESQDWEQAFVVSVAEPLRRALVRRFRSHHLDGELRTPTEWRRSFRHWAPRVLETRLTELQADVRAEEDAAISAGRVEARKAEESQAMANHRAKLAEQARRASLTPAQREVEDALETLRRSEVTLSHPGLPLSATAPARAARRKAEATLAKHGVPIPEGVQRSA